MQPLDSVPRAIARYAELGGTLDFAFFTDTDGSAADLRAAVAHAIVHARGGWVVPPPDTWPYSVDAARLAAWIPRPLSLAEFLGPGVDPRTGGLVRPGRWTTSNGQVLTDPSYRLLDRLAATGATLHSGGGPLTGHAPFVAAFTDPPYGLRGSFGRVDDLFAAVRALILPPGKSYDIRDWNTGDLTELSPYFAEGAEWWGTYLFTIHVPTDRWLTVIAGSSTD